MPAGKAPIVIAAAGTSVGANTTTKAAPQYVSPTVNVTTGYGGGLGWSIKNGASAPTVAPTLMFQVSVDGTNGSWRDYHTTGGDTVNNSENTGFIELSRGAFYIRVIVFGNATNAITIAAEVFGVTSL
jgi:hypothetical protein